MSGPFAIQQQSKIKVLTAPGALVDGASLAVTELDTLGYEHCEIYLIIGTTNTACSAAILTEGDASGTGHANIAASSFDGQTNAVGATAVLPSAANDDSVFVWSLDLRKRKRYIDATITVGSTSTGGYYTVIAILSNSKVMPVTEAERGDVADWIRI